MHVYVIFVFNDTATTEIYTLSLHDALPIYPELFERRQELPLRRSPPKRVLALHGSERLDRMCPTDRSHARFREAEVPHLPVRSEEHTSELQSRQYLVCRLLLEKKKIHTNLIVDYSVKGISGTIKKGWHKKSVREYSAF